MELLSSPRTPPLAPPLATLEWSLSKSHGRQRGVLFHYDWVLKGALRSYDLKRPANFKGFARVPAESSLTLKIHTPIPPESMELRIFPGTADLSEAEPNAFFVCGVTVPECASRGPDGSGRLEWLLDFEGARSGPLLLIASGIWDDDRIHESPPESRTYIASWLFRIDPVV